MLGDADIVLGDGFDLEDDPVGAVADPLYFLVVASVLTLHQYYRLLFPKANLFKILHTLKN